MPNRPLQQRAGRNIGIESLAVFLQAAGALPVDVAVDCPKTTLLEAVQNALRTPRMQSNSGFVFNDTGAQQLLKVYLQDKLNNSMLITSTVIPASGGPLDLTGVFSPSMPLCLCDGERLVATSTPFALPLILDLWQDKPLWMNWLGARLSATQVGPVFRVRRSSGGTMDIGLIGNTIDLAALATFCGTGQGFLVRKYNAVANAFTMIEQLDPAKQPIIYSFAPLGAIADGIVHTGGPVIGKHGYLGAYYAGDYNDGNNTGPENYLERADSLGLVGDVAVTLAGDMALATDIAPQNYSTMVSIGGDASSPSHIFAALLDLFSTDMSNYFEVDYSDSAYWDSLGSPLSSWWRCDRAAGADISAARGFVNGIQYPPTTSGSGILAFPAGPKQFRVGTYPPDSGDLYPARGVMSSDICWGLVLSPSDAALYNAWGALTYS